MSAPDPLPDPAAYATVSYSQEGEDVYLLRTLHAQATGFYVDIGAHHPYRFSNTYAFYARGWRGINVDANPETKALFDACRPRDINLETLVGETEGQEVEFDIYEEPALNSAVSARRPDITTYSPLKQTVTRKVRRLDSILREHLPAGTAIDFMSVDVEGLDLEVLRSNDWDAYRPKTLLVEAWMELSQAPASAVYLFMRSKGYKLRSFLYLTSVFERE